MAANLEEPQNSLTPIVAYIVEQGRSWNRQPDDHKDIAVMKSLYDFTNNPNNDQIRALAEAAHTTHDKTFRELLVKGVDMELAGLHEALLDALGISSPILSLGTLA